MKQNRSSTGVDQNRLLMRLLAHAGRDEDIEILSVDPAGLRDLLSVDPAVLAAREQRRDAIEQAIACLHVKPGADIDAAIAWVRSSSNSLYRRWASGPRLRPLSPLANFGSWRECSEMRVGC
jgi:hypothetical protein